MDLPAYHNTNALASALGMIIMCKAYRLRSSLADRIGFHHVTEVRRVRASKPVLGPGLLHEVQEGV